MFEIEVVQAWKSNPLKKGCSFTSAHPRGPEPSRSWGSGRSIRKIKSRASSWTQPFRFNKRNNFDKCKSDEMNF